MLLNYIWAAFFLVGFAVALARLLGGDLAIFSQILAGLFDTANTAVTISIGLVGVMCFWLGVMRIGERAGLIQAFSRALTPFFRSIFPSIPAGHPASGSMAMNFAANMLGLDNAATPLGLKGMRELQALNDDKEVASDAMIMFLVLNTAGVTLIPTSVIAIRQALAIEQKLAHFNAADIFLPTLIATFISFVSGLLAVAAFQRLPLLRAPVLGALGLFLALMAGLYFWLGGYPPDVVAADIGLLGSLIIFSIVIAFISAGLAQRVNVYEAFVDGAKDGFGVAVQIIPYLVAMLAAISVFRTTGCLDYLTGSIASGVAALGLNTDFVPALPVGLMKTLSGSGARGLMIDVMKTYGVDSFQGRLACIIQGSTETTFYVLAVYFGSVGIKHTRYAVTCGLIADFVGLFGAIGVAYLFYR